MKKKILIAIQWNLGTNRKFTQYSNNSFCIMKNILFFFQKLQDFNCLHYIILGIMERFFTIYNIPIYVIT